MSGLTVRPGDSLIITVGQELTREEADRLGDMIRTQLPELDKVIFLFGAIGTAAYRPDVREVTDRPGRPPADTSWIETTERAP